MVWLLAILIYFLPETHKHTLSIFFIFFGHCSHLTLTTQVLEDTYLIHVHTDIVLLSHNLCIGCVDISTFMLYRLVAALAVVKDCEMLGTTLMTLGTDRFCYMQ